MNYLVFLFCILVSLTSLSSAQAANKVIVVPLGGTKAQVPVTDLVSGFIQFPVAGDAILLSVPADKSFVPTDIVSSGHPNITFTLYESTTARFSSTTTENTTIATSFSSGLVWEPGSQVSATVSGNTLLSLTISGS